MAYASQSGRARTSASSPQAHAICDRCGFRFNHVDLKWQYDWRGATMQNIKILVCNRCYDTPQEQLRAIVVPADPTPIINARVQDFAAAETDYQTISAATVTDPTTGIPVPSTTVLVTQSGQNLTDQPIGIPADLDPSAVMPLVGTKSYAVKLPVLSVSSVGTTVITVTCSSAHGLSTNDQIVASGLSNANANGAYSIIVTTATAFTYATNTVIPAGSLLGANSRIITALIGLPLNYTQIPQMGI
jgi:hypothetical protein